MSYIPISGKANSGANSDITSLSGLTGGVSTPTTISMANGGVMRTTTTNAHTMSLQGYDVDGAAYANVLTVTNSNTPALSLTPTGALTITGGATSVWNLTAGSLSINAAAGNVNIGNTGTNLVYLGRVAGAVGVYGQLNLESGADLTTSVGASDLDFSLSTGQSILPTGNVTWNGATDKTVTFTGAGTGAFSFAAGSNGIQFSRSGTLVFDVGASSSTSITLGANKNFACTAGTSAFSWGSATGNFTFPTGTVAWTGASGKNVTLTSSSGLITLNGGVQIKGTSAAATADAVGLGVADINGATTAALVKTYEGGGTITERLNSNAAVKIMEIAESVADTGTIALPAPGTMGVVILSTQSGIGAIFSVDSSANIGQCSANASMANADTPATLCIYNNGGVPTIKNNLGASRFIFATYKYV